MFEVLLNCHLPISRQSWGINSMYGYDNICDFNTKQGSFRRWELIPICRRKPSLGYTLYKTRYWSIEVSTLLGLLTKYKKYNFTAYVYLYILF